MRVIGPRSGLPPSEGRARLTALALALAMSLLAVGWFVANRRSSAPERPSTAPGASAPLVTGAAGTTAGGATEVPETTPESDDRAVTAQGLGPPPLEDPDRMVNWILRICQERPAGVVDLVMSLIENPPASWDGNTRDEMRCRFFLALAYLEDPKALPLLERWKNRGPEGPGIDYRLPDDRGHSTRHSRADFTPFINEAIAHIEFVQAFSAAKTDEERASLCIKDLVRLSSGNRELYEPATYRNNGPDILLDGKDRYIPYIVKEIGRGSEQLAYDLVTLLGDVLQQGASTTVEPALLRIVESRSDSVGEHALGYLKRLGSAESFAVLDRIHETGRDLVMRPEAQLSPSERKQMAWLEAVGAASDAIRWRAAVSESNGLPDDETLRWALSRPNLRREAATTIEKSGGWTVARIVDGVQQMDGDGRFACEELLGSKLYADPSKENIAALRELVQWSLDHGAALTLSIHYLGDYGGPEERDFLSLAAARLTAQANAGALNATQQKQLQLIESTLRTWDRRKAVREQREREKNK